MLFTKKDQIVISLNKMTIQANGSPFSEKLNKTNTASKKELPIGKFQQDKNNKNNGKSYQIRPTIIKPQHVSIIGGGIASACAAYALTKQGVKVTVYCKDIKVAQGASSNKVGALYPLIH